mmetsp:Transcript_13740/g.17353  ORF Transcript_13740/g.17353 Transcript_13740/m.17353 type:complete len:408 (+) Transcript_13740:2424-3647(+)
MIPGIVFDFGPRQHISYDGTPLDVVVRLRVSRAEALPNQEGVRADGEWARHRDRAVKNEWLRKEKIEPTYEVVAVDGYVQFDGLLGLPGLQLPHGRLDLDSVRLNRICAVVCGDERAIDEHGIDNDGLLLSPEAGLRIGKASDVHHVLLADLGADQDLSLDIGGRLARVMLVLGFLVVVEGDSVLSEVVVVDGSLDIHGVAEFHLLVVVRVRKLILGEGRRNNVILVLERGRFDAVSQGALEGLRQRVEFDFGLAGVDETKTFHGHLRGPISRNEAGLSVNHVRIVEAESNVVIAVVEAIEGDLDGQDIGLGVHGDLAADSSVIHEFCWLVDGVVGWRSESHLDVLTGRVLADEIRASDRHCLTRLALQRAEGGRDRSNVRRLVVDKTVAGAWCLHVDPVLAVKRDL